VLAQGWARRCLHQSPKESDFTRCALYGGGVHIMTLERISVGLVGLGKIARDQHVPSLARDPRYRLAATADPSGACLDGVPSYPSLDAMLEAISDLDAVSICVPPQVRCNLAGAALRSGKHVLLEKPPGVSVEEVDDLIELARDRRLCLFTAWHSQFAPAVAPAKEWLAARVVREVRIIWKEDVRQWHPNQEWIWRAGGFGVFDMGINALSIATMILPFSLALTSATLTVPANRETPIAAQLSMAMGDATVEADFDWRQPGRPTWEMAVDTDAGTLILSEGGKKLSLAGQDVSLPSAGEYSGVYGRFAGLIGERSIDADLEPLRLVLEAHRKGAHVATEPFL
jgi:D-galactose 1-dehydrogenase